jgi:hypothetical protein
MSVLNLQVQLYVDGVWTTYQAYAADGWSTQNGPDVQAGLQASKVTFSLQSPNLEMDPTNAASALYGKIGRNTRARLLIDGTVVGHGEASSWAPEATVDHVPGAGRGKSWVDVEAEGLIRRLGKWTDPIASPMTRQTLLYPTLIGFWPGEDESGSLTLFQASGAAARNATIRGSVTLGGDDGAGGSGELLTLGSDARLNGEFARSAGNGYQIVFVAKLDQMPTSATYEDIFQWVDGDGRTWEWQVNNTSFQWVVTDSGGTVLESLASTFGGATPGLGYLRYRMQVTVSGSTITYNPAWYVQDGSFITGTTGTFTGTRASRPRQWEVAGNPWTDGMAFGQLFAITDTVLDVTGGDVLGAFNGYIGETPFWRWYRLTREEGFQTVWVGDWTKSTKSMGRQKPGVFLDLLEEAARTEAGLLYDHPSDTMVIFRLHNSLIGQTTALALTKSDLVPTLRKIIDDSGAANDITGQNWDGTKVRVVQESGPRSVLPPPDGVGRYKGQLDVSLRSADDFEQRVRFDLARNAVDRPRYPSLVIDLMAKPGLRAAVTALRPGDLITLSGVEPNVIPLLVMTIKRGGDGVRDTATLDCVPADVYDTGIYDSTAKRYDLRSSTMNAAVAAGVGSLVLKMTDDEAWSTTGVPYGLMIAGERVTVTAMGARTGSGPWTQTATVTRAVNGVSKTLPAGAEVHVATPGRWAL